MQDPDLMNLIEKRMRNEILSCLRYHKLDLDNNDFSLLTDPLSLIIQKEYQGLITTKQSKEQIRIVINIFKERLDNEKNKR